MSGTSEKIVVVSIDNLYDEKAEAVSMKINDRRVCTKHNFINASLKWEKPISKERIVLINFEAELKEGFHPEWGSGYGGIRYCKNCKIIDCIHLWKQHKIYVVNHNKFRSTEYLVSTCGICERNILRCETKLLQPSEEAWNLITQTYRDVLQKEFNSFDFSSGVSVELAVHISKLIDENKEEQAKSYLESFFTRP